MKWDPQGCHKVVIPKEKCFFLITWSHEIISHRAILSTLSNLQERFWWPILDEDVKCFISTCHPAKHARPIIFTFHLQFLTFPSFSKRSISTPCWFQPSMSFAISFRLAAPCHLCLSGALFGKKMKRPLGILYSKISSANGEEWPRLLLTTAPHLWLWLDMLHPVTPSQIPKIIPTALQLLRFPETKFCTQTRSLTTPDPEHCL